LFTLTAHAVVNGDHDQHALLNSLEKTIHDRFGIDHITIQLEPQDRQASEPQHF
jgi:Co/Zn/Cd efflux system component